jgi:multiple sugar transport system substrate-binding protein
MNSRRALSVLAVGLFATSSLAAAQAFNWKSQSGKTIQVMVASSPWADVLQPKLPQFEQLTGIKVSLNVLPEQQSRQKLAIDFASGGATVDVFDSGLHVEKARFIKAGWYEPLQKYLTSSRTDPKYNFTDFFASARQAIRTADGEIVGMPWKSDVEVLYYRKDIFEANKLSPPKTIEEIDQIAAKLHKPGEMYGYVARGLKNANVYTFAFPMQYFKANWVDGKGKATLTSAQTLKAMDWYVSMLKKYSPPAVISYNWGEVLGLFQQGQVAMFHDGIGFATQLEDPKSSKVAGKVGYAVLPGNIAPANTSVLAISPRSRNKDAAWLFIQWATSRDFDKELVEKGVTSPRQSSWQLASNKPLETLPWARAYFDGLKVGKPTFPEIAPIQEMRDILGIAIVQALQGNDQKKALEQANKDFQTALDAANR